MIFLVGFVVLVATVASFTRLAHEDVVTAPWRERLRQKYAAAGKTPKWFEAIDSCFRCAAVWISPIFTIPALALTAWAYHLYWTWWIVLAVLSPAISKGISYLSFLLYQRGEA